MILVTGGAGFIGAHLVAQLVERGRDVRVFELPTASVEHLPKTVEVVRGDVRDVATVRPAVRGCEQVYHLAANPNLWTRNRGDFDAVNHQGAVNVLRAALDAGAQRIMYTSTESILTSKQFSGGKVETLRLRAEDMVGPYCLSKFRGEQAAWKLAEQGAPIIIVNPTLPVGPGDCGMSPPTRMTVSFCQGKLPAVIDCRFNMIDVRDAASAMIAAMARGETLRRYLIGHQNLSLANWLELVGRHIGRPPPRWRVPYAMALGVAYFNEFWADHVTGRMPNATVTGVRLTRYCMHFDPSDSLASLGISPRPLEESVTDALAWYRNMGWI